MAIDRFSQSQFEAALPVNKHTGEPLWVSLGIEDHEYTYLLNVGALANILIRSSVGLSGYAHDTGEDSIRAWLVDQDGRPLGSKIQSYVTRVTGWQERLIKVLRELARRAKVIKACPVCGATMGVFKVKKEGPNKGRLFMACGKDCKQFHWLTEAKIKEAA